MALSSNIFVAFLFDPTQTLDLSDEEVNSFVLLLEERIDHSMLEMCERGILEVQNGVEAARMPKSHVYQANPRPVKYPEGIWFPRISLPLYSTGKIAKTLQGRYEAMGWNTWIKQEDNSPYIELLRWNTK